MKQFENAFEQARQHARAMYPEEACGFVVGDSYIPVQNIAADPAEHVPNNPNCTCRLCSFRIAKADVAKHLPAADILLHSHPDGPVYPSQMDMQSQIRMNIPWGIIALDGERIGHPQCWGDELPIPPIVGREFMHGIRDCYTLIRDVFRLGKDALAMDGITSKWPFDPIYLADKPREDAWWESDFDLYEDNFKDWGFVEIGAHEVRPGDVFLASIRSEKLNHGGVLISDDLILHHLPLRVSRREPSGIWARTARKWVRYVGKESIYA